MDSVTDYRAGNATTALNVAIETLSDLLLVAMVLKGLLDDYTSFVAVITQQGRIHDFQKLKQALTNFVETEETRINKRDKGSNKSTIIKTENAFGSNSKK